MAREQEIRVNDHELAVFAMLACAASGFLVGVAFSWFVGLV